MPNKIIKFLKPEDTLAISKFDRLDKSLGQLIGLVDSLLDKKISLKSINDIIDISNTQDKLAFDIFASLAKFKKALIKIRTTAGLDAAIEKSKQDGIPKKVRKKAIKNTYTTELLYKENKFSIRKLVAHLSIASAILYSYLKHRNVMI